MNQVFFAVLWYAAFPVTLPLSPVVAVLQRFGRTTPIPPVELVLSAVDVFLSPLKVVLDSISSGLLPQTASAAAESSSASRANRSTPFRAPRQDDRAKRGAVASSSRAADRKPATHRNAKSAPKASTEKKQSGTARSARPTKTSD
ncbi:hypothetical protein [Mycolicibacterium vinylchloridicum]|uniref:hypothetical protein n=1 Tax=Mycolicibacterium vinylchloridicum TaxID=2736928 RepID=UPI0015CAA0C1|nr:hypothetical protein [Mycolicibacterium vinylchloridicum]